MFKYATKAKRVGGMNYLFSLFSPECSPGECTSPMLDAGESACWRALKMALGEICVCSLPSSDSFCPFFTDFLRRGWYL